MDIWYSGQSSMRRTGSQYQLPDTKVCCFDSPKKGQHADFLANDQPKPALKAQKPTAK